MAFRSFVLVRETWRARGAFTCRSDDENTGPREPPGSRGNRSPDFQRRFAKVEILSQEKRVRLICRWSPPRGRQLPRSLRSPAADPDSPDLTSAFSALRRSLWNLRRARRLQGPGHLLPGEGRPAGRVRRPVGPHRRADGEREGVGDAVHG